MEKILVANRGEIARRIVRTAKQMGIKTVAIYSVSDEQALHRFDADESYLAGESPSSESYLKQEKIIEIALIAGCQAIHPGYGFLSENAAFAEKVESAGLLFIGPSVESIRTMGDKLAAKQLAKANGIPLLPGSEIPIADLKKAKEMAQFIGYPILLKAAGGGGGKGMRIVKQEGELDQLLRMASSEAHQSFGDDRVFVEKYLENPKHIEIQVMADQHGNAVHIFERDCSIQRRHQKVIEESPAPTMDLDLRQKMTDAALKLTKACNYRGAGTIEFLVDQTGQFFFLEMNTRLQVEHPVTEAISGIDLVRWQIDIANGKPLPLTQDQITIKGHSIELRVYAEDTTNNFSPSLGKIIHYDEPVGQHIRVDSAVAKDFDVPIYYDPMLAKLIVWGEDRSDAINRLKQAIAQYHILGIDTTLPLGLFVANHPDFENGHYSTHFIQTHFDSAAWHQSIRESALIASLVAAAKRRATMHIPQENRELSDHWKGRKFS
ncbi:MAG: acetyl-CoA carboxylase biotin carboxylase subunit [Saprospiraceae bacterium]|nr:acetyl-CoA carboxylase biotin carboxylase subunit [Saprospiraceae bacterium]